MLVKVQKGVAGLITEAIAIISEHSHRNREGTAGIQVQVKVPDSRSPCQSWVPKFLFSSVEAQSMEGEEQCASYRSRH